MNTSATTIRRVGRFALAIAASLALWLALPAAAAESPSDTARLTASKCFLEMPVEVLDILPKSARFDMLAYFEADSVYRARNAMDGESYLVSVAPDFLEVRVTDVSTLQIKLLPAKKGEDLVMTVYTVGGDGQAKDSDIRFFSADMKEQNTDRHFTRPELKRFFYIPKGAVTTMKEIEQTIPFPTVEYSAAPGTTSLEAKLTVGEFMNQDDYNVIKLFEKPGLTLVWDGSKYRLQK